MAHMAIAGTLIATGFNGPVWLTNLIAFACAFWASYFGHRHFTFRVSGSPAKFLGAALAGLAVNNVCLVAAYTITWHDFASIAIAAIASPVAVFIISRLWVFNEQA